MLWGWAKRRHPMKAHKWIKNKYWKSINTKNWIFKSETNQLKLLSDKRINRTTPIKLDKNPYLDKDYWLTYKIKEGSQKLTGMYKKVWDRQKGICPFCGLMIEVNGNAEERPLHHKDGNHKNHIISNLAYVHSYCHRQYHALNTNNKTNKFI